MDNETKKQNGFTYTYSAKEQTEVKRIRDKYTAPLKAENEDKMARLRRLDASVVGTARAVALVFGVIGTLILGFGMSLVMTELSESLGISGDVAMVIGIIVGIVGGFLASLAYPIYNAIVKEKQKRIAPEIIRLADELIK